MKNLFNLTQGRPGYSRAFTIIELLIVIAIMALLTGIIMTSLVGSKAKSRDTKRISDLGQIQLAIELYFDRCKEYPATLATAASNGFGTPTGCFTLKSITLATYISVIPRPPAGAGQTDYIYTTNDPAGGHPSDYVLRATLESPNDVIKDALPSNPIDGACDQDPTTKQYCLGPK